MADRIVVMHDGVVEQVGEPLDLYDNPANLFVAGFIGSPAMNFINATIKRNGGAPSAVAPDGTVLPLSPQAGGRDGQKVVYGIRPEHLDLTRTPRRPAVRGRGGRADRRRHPGVHPHGGPGGRGGVQGAPQVPPRRQDQPRPRTPARSTCSTRRPATASRADRRARRRRVPPRLTPAHLDRLPGEVARPRYDRARLPVGIVHLGLGAFHRAHQALYTEDALGIRRSGRSASPASACAAPRRATAWRRRRGCSRSPSASAAGERLRVVGCLKEILVAPEDPAAVVRRIADPAISIVSLTVTEKGYGHDPASGVAASSATRTSDTTSRIRTGRAARSGRWSRGSTSGGAAARHRRRCCPATTCRATAGRCAASSRLRGAPRRALWRAGSRPRSPSPAHGRSHRAGDHRRRPAAASRPASASARRRAGRWPSRSGSG